MRYQSIPFQGFGKGLNLRDKPDAVDAGECVDAMNVLFSDRGAIQQRPGYRALTESELTNRVESLEAFYTTAGTKQLLAGCGDRLEAISTAGAVVDSETGLANAVWDFARFGKPNEEVAYAGNGTDTIRKWSGSAWSTPKATVDGETEKAMPKGGLLCVSPADNRLVVSGFSTTTGGPNGLVSSPSHVYFSEVGDPESYETTSFVQFTPGDGERIQAVLAWKEFVFVFKETKFFVIPPPSVDGEGRPIFNYRPVEGGAGLVSPRAVVAHPSGIYFMARNGVYRTTGQEPELVSSLVDPIWSGDFSPFYTGGTLNHAAITKCAMGVWEDRIHLAFPSGGSVNDRVLVYDPQFEWWSIYDLPASCLTKFRVDSTEELVFGYASGVKEVGQHSSEFTNDAETAITSYFRSGWPDFEQPDIKKIRATKVWGTGVVAVGVSKDFEQSSGSLDVLNLASPPGATWGGTTWGAGTWSEPLGLLAQERRKAIRGTVFSTYFFNATKDQGWSVHRLEHLVPAVRQPAKVTA